MPWALVRLVLVAVVMILGLRLLRGATALAFGLASIATLLLFQLPLGRYTEKLYGQASDLTIFMIVLFGALLFLLSRPDLLERQARRLRMTGTGSLGEEESRLDREVAVLCLLQQFSGAVQGRIGSRPLRGLALLPLALINFVSSATSALLFKSLWAPTRSDLTSDAAGRTQAAGILCLCTTGVLAVNFAPLLSTWWLFFTGVAGRAWTEGPPLGVWIYALLSYAHGYWLLTRHGEPSLPLVEPETRRLRGSITCSWSARSSPFGPHSPPCRHPRTQPTARRRPQARRPKRRPRAPPTPSGAIRSRCGQGRPRRERPRPSNPNRRASGSAPCSWDWPRHYSWPRAGSTAFICRRPTSVGVRADSGACCWRACAGSSSP
jgi:hypothetical protein